jgi:hypothetical protein
MRRAPFLFGVFALVLSATLSGLSPVASAKAGQVAIPSADSGKCSLTWPGFEDQIEQQLTEGKVLKLEDVPIGVTKPQRATLEGGTRFAWKPLQPGYSKGFMESYKAEIAAYKLDRMLELHMVPPIVERKMEGKTGAAVFWIENTRPWNVKAPPQGPEPMWSRQLTKMKMLDLLIANIDRNQGNLMYDADWHIFLIDHSRAFIDKKDLKGIAPLGRVERKLWEKMQALTIEDLDRGLEKWVGDKEKKALLIRRDLMAKEINALIKKHGEKFVFYDDFDKPKSH